MTNESKVNLDNLMIAAPCNVGWENMTGTETMRHCHECKLNVYNISNLTAPEAEKLLSSAAFSQGNICLKFYRRHDGTIITSDCPQGLRRIRSARPRFFRTIAATFAALGAAIPAYAEEVAPLKLGQASVKDDKSTATAKKTEEFKSVTLPGQGSYTMPLQNEMEVLGVPSGAPMNAGKTTQLADRTGMTLFSEAYAEEMKGNLETAKSKYSAVKETLATTKYDPSFQRVLSDSIETALARILSKQEEIRAKEKLQQEKKAKSATEKVETQSTSGAATDGK